MDNNTELPHNLIAFVNDPVSEQIIWDVIKEKNMAYAEAYQGGLSDALNFVNTNRTPKVLLIDISASELPISEIKKIQEHSTPNLNIIAIGSKNEVGIFRDLMDIGVSDYLVKPLNNTILDAALDKANGNKNLVEKTGKIVQFISSVGGAGSTTVASNIACLFANRYFKRSLLMDTDFLFGTGNMMLDIKAENAYLDILESPDKIDDYFIETILKKHDQRLYYLGGLVDLVRGIVVDDSAFDALMSTIKRQFNYIILDTQRTMSSLDRICFNYADSYVIMAELSLASAQNTARLLDFFNASHSGKRISIIINKVGLSSAGALPRESFEKIVDREVNYMLPLDENVVLASANIGQPLVMSDSALTDVLVDIAEDILGRHESQKIIDRLKKQETDTVAKIKNTIFDFINDLSKRI